MLAHLGGLQQVAVVVAAAVVCHDDNVRAAFSSSRRWEDKGNNTCIAHIAAIALLCCVC